MRIIKLLFLALTLAFCQTAFAQDKLLLRNGDEMVVKVLEITPDSLLFTKTSDSVTVKAESILKSAIFSITYQNGKKDVMPEPKQEPAPLSEGRLYATGRAGGKA